MNKWVWLTKMGILFTEKFCFVKEVISLCIWKGNCENPTPKTENELDMF